MTTVVPRPTPAQMQFDPKLPGTILKVGLLEKSGPDGTNWKIRLCALTNRGELHYFEPLESPATKVVNTTKQLKGKVNCRESVIRPSAESGLLFQIQPCSGDRCYLFRASTMAEREEWLAEVSQFGDGPLAQIPPQSSGHHAVGATSMKAKELLFGDSAAPVSSTGIGTHHPTAKELRMLGVSEATHDKFKHNEKVYKTLGAFAAGGPNAHQVVLDEDRGNASAGAGNVAASSNNAQATPAQPTPVATILKAREAQGTHLIPPDRATSLGILPGGANIYTCGILSKLGGASIPFSAAKGNWQKRFFVLTTAGILHYWESSDSLSSGSKPKGLIDCNRSQIRFLDPQEFNPPQSHAFSLAPIAAGSKVYALACSSLSEREWWVGCLSFFGEGPATAPAASHTHHTDATKSAPIPLSSKAKDLLYGGHKAKDAKERAHAGGGENATPVATGSPASSSSVPSAVVLDRLGTSARTMERFSALPKAYAKLGLFNEDHPSATMLQKGTRNQGTSMDVRNEQELQRQMVRYNITKNLIPSSSILFVGQLVKTGGSIKTLKERYFVLTHEGLFYYTDGREEHPKGWIDLTHGARLEDDVPNCTKEGLEEFQYAFSITPLPPATGTTTTTTPESREYMLFASSEEERSEWCQAIRSVLKRIEEEKQLKRARSSTKSSLQQQAGKK